MPWRPPYYIHWHILHFNKGQIDENYRALGNWFSELLKVRWHVPGKFRAVALGISSGFLIFIISLYWKLVYVFKFSSPSCGSLQTFPDLRVMKQLQRWEFPILAHLCKPFCGWRGSFDYMITIACGVSKVTSQVSGVPRTTLPHPTRFSDSLRTLNKT